MFTKRLGLSFETAPPRPAHPNRTDIACFVGTVARRKVIVPARVMAPVLARWVKGLGFPGVGDAAVDTLSVDLASSSAFVDSLVAQAGPNQRDALARALRFETPAETARARKQEQLAALVAACRDLSLIPAPVIEDLRLRGFYPGGLLGPDELAGWLRTQHLRNLAVPVESFEEFERLFAWEARPVLDGTAQDSDPVVTTSLGAAVRAFFGEGGARAHIVRTGDPVPVFGGVAERFAGFNPEPRRRAGNEDGPTPIDVDRDRCCQIPGVTRVVRLDMLADVMVESIPLAPDPADWQGLEHVYGLPEVSFVCLPDLIDACAQAVPAEIPPAEVIATVEAFRECVEESPPDQLPVGRRLPAPALNSLGLEVWRQLVGRALELLSNPGRPFHRRDVQLLASLPLPGDGRDLPVDGHWLEWMAGQPGWLAGAQSVEHSVVSDRLQVAFPWLITPESADCAGGAEAPEGTLAGLLARSALQKGSYRSAAGQAVTRYQSALPALEWSRATQEDVPTPLGTLALAERICLIGPAARGTQLLSDVTWSGDTATRQGAVRRLINVVIQAARQAGDEFAFEPNGPALWTRVRETLADLCRVLVAGGALSTDGVPFIVSCGPDTMTQNDIDAGRLIAEVSLLPAQPIQRIVVVLALRDAQAPSALRAA